MVGIGVHTFPPCHHVSISFSIIIFQHFPRALRPLGPWLLAILDGFGQDTVELLADCTLGMLNGNMPAIMRMFMGMLMHVNFNA